MYFPDGTWCNNDGGEDYFCLKHQCISESQSRQPRKSSGPDIEILQNAKPGDQEPEQSVLDFFIVDEKGNQKNEDIPASDKDQNNDDEFTQDDELTRDKRAPNRDPRDFEPDTEYEQDEPLSADWFHKFW